MCTCQRMRDAGMIGTGRHAFVTFRRNTISEIGSWIAKYGFGNLGLPVWIQKLRLPIWMAGASISYRLYFFPFCRQLIVFNSEIPQSKSGMMRYIFSLLAWLDESLLWFSICMDWLRPVTTKIQFLIHFWQTKYCQPWSGWYCLFRWIWTVSWKMTRTKYNATAHIEILAVYVNLSTLPSPTSAGLTLAGGSLLSPNKWLSDKVVAAFPK